MRRRVTLVVLLCLVAPNLARAQERDRYLLLATQRTGTMQGEINDASARGYRVLAATRTEGTEVVVVLEQAVGEYKYKLIATTRTGTLQKELNDAAEQGYRVIPLAVTTKRTQGRLAGALSNSNPGEGELLILMEKGPAGNNGALYEVLATTKTGTLQKELGEAGAKGFKLIALVSRGEHLAIMERTSAQ